MKSNKCIRFSDGTVCPGTNAAVTERFNLKELITTFVAKSYKLYCPETNGYCEWWHVGDVRYEQLLMYYTICTHTNTGELMQYLLTNIYTYCI